MAFNYRFTPEALAEFDAAIEWYESRYKGLGKKFSERVYHLIQTVCSMPDAFPCLWPNLRRAHVENYPYSLLYNVVGSEVMVYSVFHEKRNPAQWQQRFSH